MISLVETKFPRRKLLSQLKNLEPKILSLDTMHHVTEQQHPRVYIYACLLLLLPTCDAWSV